ncbi:DUF4331 family protein [Actinomadura geliboluensis]|uniref:DUF4331 family protein n=1 Tax=Actinomadura geliboluensis TaxID=882440 RepID=UPI00197A85CC
MRPARRTDQSGRARGAKEGRAWRRDRSIRRRGRPGPAPTPDTTTLIANVIPFQDPAGGPNFSKFARDARYDLNIDNDGDSLPDLTYRFRFHDRLKNPNTFLYNAGPVTGLDEPDLTSPRPTT